jgi:hypothetical protein
MPNFLYCCYIHCKATKLVPHVIMGTPSILRTTILRTTDLRTTNLRTTNLRRRPFSERPFSEGNHSPNDQSPKDQIFVAPMTTKKHGAGAATQCGSGSDGSKSKLNVHHRWIIKSDTVTVSYFYHSHLQYSITISITQ